METAVKRIGDEPRVVAPDLSRLGPALGVGAVSLDPVAEAKLGRRRCGLWHMAFLQVGRQSAGRVGVDVGPAILHQPDRLVGVMQTPFGPEAIDAGPRLLENLGDPHGGIDRGAVVVAQPENLGLDLALLGLSADAALEPFGVSGTMCVSSGVSISIP
jgi:hypothetical protein